MEVSQLLVNSFKRLSRGFSPRDRTGKNGEAWTFPMPILSRWLRRGACWWCFCYACPVQRLQVRSPLLRRQQAHLQKKLHPSSSSLLSAERKAKRSSTGYHSLNPKEYYLHQFNLARKHTTGDGEYLQGDKSFLHEKASKLSKATTCFPVMIYTS